MTQDPGPASWLQLSLTPGLGAATIRELLKQFGLPEKVLSAPRAALARIAKPEALAALDSEPVARAVEQALAWLEQPGCSVVTLADAHYPRLLLEIPDPPPLLYCRGRTELLNQPALAVVGSRNATAQGTSNAEQFARGDSYGLLLALLVVLYVLIAAESHRNLWGRFFISVVLGGVLLLAFHTSHVRARAFTTDLNAVLRDLEHTWSGLARDKWKLEVSLEWDGGPGAAPSACASPETLR